MAPTIVVLDSTLAIDESRLDHAQKLRFISHYDSSSGNTGVYMLSAFSTSDCYNLYSCLQGINCLVLPKPMMILNSFGISRAVLAVLKPKHSLATILNDSKCCLRIFIETFNVGYNMNLQYVSSYYKQLIYSLVYGVYYLIVNLNDDQNVSSADNHIFFREEPPSIIFTKFTENQGQISWSVVTDIIQTINECFREDNSFIMNLLNTNVYDQVFNAISNNHLSPLEMRDAIHQLPLFWSATEHTDFLINFQEAIDDSSYNTSIVEQSVEVQRVFDAWKWKLNNTRIGHSLIFIDNAFNGMGILPCFRGLRNVLAHFDAHMDKYSIPGIRDLETFILFLNDLWPEHLYVLNEVKKQFVE